MIPARRKKTGREEERRDRKGPFRREIGRADPGNDRSERKSVLFPPAVSAFFLISGEHKVKTRIRNSAGFPSDAAFRGLRVSGSECDESTDGRGPEGFVFELPDMT